MNKQKQKDNKHQNKNNLLTSIPLLFILLAEKRTFTKRSLCQKLAK
jgi:hypothetical protein